MTKLYRYQKIAVKKTIRFKGRTLIAFEMGLGKTLIALTYLRIRPRHRPVLVICPASAKWVWRAEIRKHTDLSCRILNGKNPKPLRRFRDVTIINFEILDAWKNMLKQVDFKILVIDECHRIKSPRAKCTKVTRTLGKRISRILALSGTPLTNRPKELFSTLHLLRPDEFPSFVSYAFRYCNRKMTYWGWDDTGESHLDELHKRLIKSCMIRRTKKQVLPDLPDKTRIVVPLPILRRSEYKRAEKNFLGWLAEREPKRAKKIWRSSAQEIVKLGRLKRLAADLKMPMVFDWIDTLLEETDGKLVVFAYHSHIIDQLQARYGTYTNKMLRHREFASTVARRLQGKGTGFSVVIKGGTSQKQRQRNVERFQKSKRTRLLIGQILAAGTAITLTSASAVVFVELDWVPGNHIQAEDRIHRIGQKKKVFVYYLVARGTIEQKLCKIIQRKAEIISAILDGKKHKSDFNVFDQLMKWMKRLV